MLAAGRALSSAARTARPIRRERRERTDAASDEARASRDASTFPTRERSVLIQPAGRTWDYFHEVILHWFGAIVILGMIAVLALGYLVLGRLRISAGRSGQEDRPLQRLRALLALADGGVFRVLGLTGLNITFGKLLLLPLIGPDAFSAFAQVAKYAHNFVSFAFVLGLVLIVAFGSRTTSPTRSTSSGSSRAAASSSRSTRPRDASTPAKRWCSGSPSARASR